jgi:hypothetical protein
VIRARATLPSAHTTVLYDVSLDISGGRAPYSIAVVAGYLPPGLALDQASGAIKGIAIRSGTWHPLIRVIDAAGKRQRKQFTLTVWKVTAAYCARTLLCHWTGGPIANIGNGGR